jgi:hypothetical protein
MFTKLVSERTWDELHATIVVDRVGKGSVLRESTGGVVIVELSLKRVLLCKTIRLSSQYVQAYSTDTRWIVCGNLLMQLHRKKRATGWSPYTLRNFSADCFAYAFPASFNALSTFSGLSGSLVTRTPVAL